ncbi:MAG: right-handed parallel beta-helix repeat-containing protein [Candidatus Thiodiazotropha taylori]|nr:right-handed parallel beta-helix repeat-containing protein [Candidatus Thiodiazotropha taylori]MCG8066396.1 right-handed parallel beta-helix repeat-containing protein [Candidatus Thiodiazotropha taylori]
MERRVFIKGLLTSSLLAALPIPRFNLKAALPPVGGRVWNYIGIHYPTDPLPGISGSPATIPIMPTLPNGAYYTAHDWYSGIHDSYDPCAIPNPQPPVSVTEGEYVVNRFHPNASDSDQGDNAIAGVVYGTTSRPRVSLPSVMPAAAGTKVFVFGDGTPRPTAYNSNRKVDYDNWAGVDWAFNGSRSNPCWIIGIGEPRIECNETTIANSTHLIVDGIVFDTSVFYGSSFDLDACQYITFRNSAQYGINKNGLFDVSNSQFVMYYNNEVAYTGYSDGNHNGSDRHGVRPLYGARYVWFVDCHIHSVSGDAMQAGNSANRNPQSESPHFVYFAGNHCHNCGENAVDNKNSYHVVISECEFHDFKPEYNADGGTAVILSNNDEGPWTGFHWIIGSKIYDCQNGIRDSSDQDGEFCYVIGNVLYDITDGALVEQDSNRVNHETVYWVNNTIHNCGYGYLRARQQRSYDSYLEGNLFHNLVHSVFASNGGSGLRENDADSSMHVSNNLMYGNATGTPTTGWASWANNIVGDSSSEDPRLTNPDQQIFTLADGSPAIDAVETESVAFQHFSNLYGMDIRCDYLGNLRNNGSMDIGATESSGAGGLAPPSPPILLGSM